MIYECKENSTIIELSRDGNEIMVYEEGDSSKSIIGINDLINSLDFFENNINNNTE